MMLEELQSHLDDLITLLIEVGAYQLSKQNQVKAQSKSSHQNFAQTWINNDIFSEVDLCSEKRLIEFFKSRFDSSDFSFITEEYHAKKPQNSTYYVVIDPLDGTKPYLKGEKTFGISLGICREDKFLFGCNYYPAFNDLIYAFHNVEGVYNQHHKQIIPPKVWASTCSVASRFPYLVKDSSAMKNFIKSELGLTFVVVPDCATYRFKLMLEGLLGAYFSENLFIWDIGPSSLLMEKVGISMVNPLANAPVAVPDLLIPPFVLPLFLAAPQDEINEISNKLRTFVGGESSAIEASKERRCSR